MKTNLIIQEQKVSPPLEVTFESVRKKAEWYGFSMIKVTWTNEDTGENSFTFELEHEDLGILEFEGKSLEEIDQYLNTIEK